MDPIKRTLLKVIALPEERARTNDLLDSLMSRRPELLLAFIQEHAKEATDPDV